MKIAWLVDSTASLPKHLIEHEDVYVVSMEIVSGEQTFRDTIDLTNDEFYLLMKNKKDFLKTSQPTLNSFVETYTTIKDRGYDAIFSIHISSFLSGTYSTSIQATQMVDMGHCKVFVIDSKIGAYPLSVLVEKGLEFSSKEYSLEMIHSLLLEECKKTKIFVIVNNLEQLKRSGRLSNSQYLLGSLLNVKLVLQTNEGKLEVFDKTRSFKKSKSIVLDVLMKDMDKHQINELFIMEANCMEEALKLNGEISSLYPSLDIHISPLSTSISVHTGEGSMAFSWFCS